MEPLIADPQAKAKATDCKIVLCPRVDTTTHRAAENSRSASGLDTSSSGSRALVDTACPISGETAFVVCRGDISETRAVVVKHAAFARPPQGFSAFTSHTPYDARN